ncbi:MAG: biopolymer transporter ExbD [Proteobacteria bacterium]|nr:biopolymer transporter ExbD [Pseudomonadota bacterium]
MLGSGHATALGGHSDEEEEVYLNLTPMIDILTCLLFFLLISFGAVIIALISASVPVLSDGDADPNASRAKVTMGLQITDSALVVSASHDTMSEAELAGLRKTLPKRGNDYDFDGLHQHLLSVKKKYPNSTTIVITPAAAIPYEAVVKAMDASRDRPGGTKRRPLRLPVFPEAVVSTIVE